MRDHSIAFARRARRQTGRLARRLRAEIDQRRSVSLVEETTVPEAPVDVDDVIVRTRAVFDGHPSDAPLVSVVIPNYNDARFVAATIESVRRQSVRDFECLIVDDASTDESVSVITAAIADDDRFMLIRHVVNGGLSASRNTGMRLARGALICFLDSDDFFRTDNLAVRINAFADEAGDESLIGVFSRIAECSEDASIDDPLDGPSGGAPAFVDHISARGACPFNCHAPLLRTAPTRRMGGFDETMRGGAEDWDFWLRLLRHGYWFRGIDEILGAYRQKRSSMIRTMPGDHLAEAARLLGSVQEPLDPQRMVAGTPARYHEPLGRYDTKMALARRVLTFAGIAAQSSDDGSTLDVAIDRLDPVVWPAVKRHMRVTHLLNAGIRRGMAASPEEFEGRRPEADRIRKSIVRTLDQRSAEAISSAESSEPAPCPTVLFVPETPEQITRMSQVLARVQSAEVSAGLISLEPIADPGFAQVDVGDRSTIPINELLLSERTPEVVVVAWPHGSATSTIIDRFSAAGTEVVTLPSEVARLEPAPGPQPRPVTAEELVALVEGRTSGERSVRWTPPDPGRAALATIEEYPHLPADIADMASFRDRHRGERCVVIGNGPSLNSLDLSLLAGQTTIAVNGIFYADLPEPPSYYVVEDTSVMRENLEAIRTFDAGHKFFPTIYREMWEAPTDNVTFFTMNRGFYSKISPHFCVPRFSFDASQRLYCGQSVTIINLQLAYWMGFEEVILIGMDFSYTIPDSAERDGDLITSNDDDPNHFHPDYFGAGKTWKDPKLDRVRNNYQLVRSVYEATGRSILNATPGGSLDVFTRVDFVDAMRA